MAEDEFLTEEQLEVRLQCRKGALRQRRHRGLYLPYIKLGAHSIRYHWPTVVEYLLKQSNFDPAEYKRDKLPNPGSRNNQATTKRKRGRPRKTTEGV